MPDCLAVGGVLSGRCSDTFSTYFPDNWEIYRDLGAGRSDLNRTPVNTLMNSAYHGRKSENTISPIRE
jgi:hypothetical protein